jgi:uncharacterized protein (DUF488 family)
MKPFYTIGHSSLPIEAFIGLLRREGVQRVVDVRKLPGSRAYPVYNGDALAAALQPFQIGYEHVPALGGRRPKDRTADPARNGFWENQSFHNYADYAAAPAFQRALRDLLSLGREETCALMCAEAVWWRCHRRIIADHLMAAGAEVFHIGQQKTEPARLTEAAVVEEGIVSYPTPSAQMALPFAP